jgi:hypothetical protein
MSTHPFDSSPFAGVKLKNVPQHLQAEASHYNMQAAARWENYGKVANAVDAAMADQDRICKAFDKEGWDGDEGGWVSPNGILDYDWVNEYGLPLPGDLDWESYKLQKRTEHGWKLDDSGWYAPCGKHETEVSGLAPEYII